MTIIQIRNKDIDKKKYDQCIEGALNGTVYALSWYLDITFPNWQLLATPDYSYVMPLSLKRKFGIPIVIQPIHSQQLGIFSSQKITPDITNTFVDKISAMYIQINLNSGNEAVSDKFTLRANYVLDMSKQYETIRNNYNKNTKTLLKKAQKQNLKIEKHLNLDTDLSLVFENSPYYPLSSLPIGKKIITKANEKNLLIARGVKESGSDNLIAIAFFIHWNNTFYYLFPYSSKPGKEKGAMRFLIDNLIAEFAGKASALDFEGSTIPSVAQFYESFGAILKPYPMYFLSKFPRFIEKFKK